MSMSESSQVKLHIILKQVREQIDANAFEYRDKNQVDELCLIIAEVMYFPEGMFPYITINKEPYPIGLVKEIYARLTYDHISIILHNLNPKQNPIRYKKSYLRTLLYNVVFEMELAVAEENIELIGD